MVMRADSAGEYDRHEWTLQGSGVDEVTEQQLIEQAAAGKTAAFEQLVESYQDRLIHSLAHSLCSYEDAREIAQQAFLQAWLHLGSFRGEAGFYSWLYRIARNALISQKRRQRLPQSSWPADSQGRPLDVADSLGTADEVLQSAEQVQMVQKALALVSDDFRQPLVLKELDGCSYEEISQLLDIPLGTVRSRIFRGRQELSEHLQRLIDTAEPI